VFLLNNTNIFRALIAIVVLSPLPFGSYRPWAWSLFAILIGVLLILWCFIVLKSQLRASVPMIRLWPVIIPFVAVLAWAFVQTISSVPHDWIHPLWTETTHTLGKSVTASISLDPELTLTAILRTTTYGGIFLLSSQLGRDRYRAHHSLVAIAVAGIIYAIYGLLNHFAGWDHILWMEKWAYLGDLTSTFVNRNAYGAYAGLGIICCMGLFLHTLRPSKSTPSRRAYDFAEIVLVRAMPFLIGVVIISTALLLSHSRGAFVCTALALLVLMVAAMASRLIRPRTALVIGGLIVTVGVGILGLSGEGTVERLASTPAQIESADDARTNLYRLTTDAIIDAPLIGHGFGTFLPTFRMYRDTSLVSPYVWDFAHNVYLEMAMDLGLPASILLYLSLTVVVISCIQGLVCRRRDHIYPAVAIGAITLIGSHSLIDFSVQIPAIAMTLALLLGVGFAQSWGTINDATSTTITTNRMSG